MKSPKDSIPFSPSRPIAVGALLTTVTACILIVVQAVMDYQEGPAEVSYPAPTLEGSFKVKSSFTLYSF